MNGSWLFLAWLPYGKGPMPWDKQPDVCSMLKYTPTRCGLLARLVGSGYQHTVNSEWAAIAVRESTRCVSQEATEHTMPFDIDFDQFILFFFFLL